jgi:DNA-binding transcriptional ArsR family regulator
MRNHVVTYSAQTTFDALADPTRRAMLDLLRDTSLPAGQIARAFPVSRPAISKHLRLLRRAHLVQERRDGRRRVYRLEPAPLRTVDSWLNRYRIFWQANLASLKIFVESQDEKDGSGPRTRRKKKK